MMNWIRNRHYTFWLWLIGWSMLTFFLLRDEWINIINISSHEDKVGQIFLILIVSCFFSGLISAFIFLASIVDAAIKEGDFDYCWPFYDGD